MIIIALSGQRTAYKMMHKTSVVFLFAVMVRGSHKQRQYFNQQPCLLQITLIQNYFFKYRRHICTQETTGLIQILGGARTSNTVKEGGNKSTPNFYVQYKNIIG